MINRDKEHTEEHKDANKKTVTVGGKEKLLLMDDEEPDNESELHEMIAALIEEALADISL